MITDKLSKELTRFGENIWITVDAANVVCIPHCSINGAECVHGLSVVGHSGIKVDHVVVLKHEVIGHPRIADVNA